MSQSRRTRGGTATRSSSDKSSQHWAKALQVLASHGLVIAVCIVVVIAFICLTSCVYFVVNGNESNVKALSTAVIQVTEKTWINVALGITTVLSTITTLVYRYSSRKFEKELQRLEQTTP